MSVDPELLATWTRGWALTRGVAPPTRDRDAWRIEVCQPDQIRRFVYANPCDDLARRGAEITASRVFLKVCAAPEAVRPSLSPDWEVRQTGVLMVLDAGMVPLGDVDGAYRLDLWSEGPVRMARLHDSHGQEAARGRAVRVDDRVIYDRIAVAEAHRRRGLGSRIMRTLQAGQDGWGQGILVATDEGARLYAALGWHRLSPYTTAVRLDPDGSGHETTGQQA